MTVVLDASAGIEIVLNRSRSAQFQEYIEKSGNIISTDLYKAEITNVMWKYVKANLITKEKGSELLILAIDLIDEFHDMQAYYIESFCESVRLNHPAYDLFSQLLARRTGAVLLSADTILNTLAINEGIETYLLHN
jgi:predicted nucleic acid-binding protein